MDASDLKPDDGLNPLPDALLFCRVQGSVSAANIFLLNAYNDHVDMAWLSAAAVLKRRRSTSARRIRTRSRSANSSARPTRWGPAKKTPSIPASIEFVA